MRVASNALENNFYSLVLFAISGIDYTIVLSFSLFDSDVANVAVACLHNVRDSFVK